MTIHNKDVDIAPFRSGGMRRRLLSVLFVLTVLTAFAVGQTVGFVQADGVAQASAGMPLSEEQGRRFAEAAGAFADVAYVSGDEQKQGVPYVWGGRTGVAAFVDAAAGGGGSEDGLEGVGVDASGLVVGAMKDAFPEARFFVPVDGGVVLWSDANSAALFQHNVVALEPSQVRAGDLVFFGTSSDDGAVQVSGVGVVTGRSGLRVDFVVASAGQGRVIRTFARIDGEYWQNNIVGVGRLAPGGSLGD